jgi:hypothetical protein
VGLSAANTHDSVLLELEPLVDAVPAVLGPRGRPGRPRRHRWRVERSLAWLVDFRYLQVRHGRRADYLQAFLHLACALICVRLLKPL